MVAITDQHKADTVIPESSLPPVEEPVAAEEEDPNFGPQALSQESMYNAQMQQYQAMCQAYGYPPMMPPFMMPPYGYPPVMMPPYGYPGPWHGPGGGGGGAYGGAYGGHRYEKGRGEGSNGGDKSEMRASGPLKGRVWQMARDSHGCRTLQDAFDQAKGDDDRAALAFELQGHVWEAIECKNANHVLQKYIVTMRPEASQFIIDELMEQRGNAWHAARHCFGCRVVERLLEHCRRQQVEAMVAEILQDAVGLCKHQYGNYVAQHLLEHGTVEQQHQLAKVIQEHAQPMCTDYHAVAVVSQALCCGAINDRVAVARAVLNQRGLVVSMARSRHGQEAVKHLLQMPAQQEREKAWNLLNDNLSELQRSRYGRVVAKYLGSQGPQLNQGGQDGPVQEVKSQEENGPDVVADRLGD